MDTSALKPFAQRMRTTLMDGVANRLRYWGFADGPEPTHTVEPIEGGYLFRSAPGNDPTVPKKWRALKKAVRNHGVEAVQEAAAATWFNRLMALRILEMNSYESTVLGYAPDTQEPRLLYNARQGIVPYGTDRQKQQVEAALQEPNDNAAFRTLLLAYYAEHTLLNDVFGRVSDYTELLLPANLLDPDGPIDRLVTTEAIADDDYAQVELIGWLYQFYISEKKDAVYDQSGKFAPEDIPAATQIFTPRWIVRYLVENTLGTQWLQAEPDSPLRDDMEYLVDGNAAAQASGQPEVEQAGVQGDAQAAPASNGASDPQSDMFADEAPGAAGDTEPLVAWDGRDLEDLVLFDPAVGSGHILVVGFDLLMAMYRERGYTDRQAVEHILTNNLKGLDIDRRAAQLARFALLMKAAEYDPRALQRDVRPQVYFMPEPRSFSDADLRTYFDDAVFEAHGEALHEALALLAEHGQNVGAALQLDLSDDARTAIAREVSHWKNKTEGSANLTEQALVHELNAYLQPLLLMTGTYPAVVMNPPYMGSRQMNKALKAYAKKHYPMSKRDLFAVFMEVGEENTQPAGRLGMINQQSWMFLSSYEDLRTHVLDTTRIASMLHLGPNTFDEISGEVVQSTAFVLQNTLPQGRMGTYFRLVDEPNSTAKKEAFERHDHRHTDVDQRDFEKIPGAPIAYW
ncbi:MAG: BREX-1 system adenine-specific DNA-methyltransferase PglX, partial [Longimonas sp.]|uniref:BREX-1 system adenine-specific DNA-methyltransferase PglX n=1 Tax=Longimonas sp. TaxID=2039626 RepID=UPI003347A809